MPVQVSDELQRKRLLVHNALQCSDNITLSEQTAATQCCSLLDFVVSCPVVNPCAFVADIIFFSPSPGAKFNSFEEIRLEWTSSGAAPPTTAIHLLEYESWVIVETLTPPEGILSTLHTFSWQVPQWVATGEYFFAATASPTDPWIIGAGPDLNNGTGITITRLPCAHHTVCGGNNYCDWSGQCYDCTYCPIHLDAIDGQCPLECGGQQSSLQVSAHACGNAVCVNTLS